MNSNLVELLGLTILQLITIRNISDGDNIKPQVMKRLANLKSQSFILDS